MSPLSLVLAALLAISLTGCLLLALRVRRLCRRLPTATLRAEERQLATAQLRRIEQQQEFFTQFLREFPHLTRELDSRVKPRRIPQILLDIMVRTFEPERAVVLIRRQHSLVEPDRERRLVVAAVAPEDGIVSRGAEVVIGSGDLGLVAELQRGVDRKQLESLPGRDLTASREPSLPGFVFEAAAPMVVAGRTLGVLAYARPLRHNLPQLELLRLIAQMGAFTLHNVSAYAEAKSAADLDGLTGVYNKRVLGQRLSQLIFQAERVGEPLSIFLFDIDHFKVYNDLNGHLAGDELLRQLARLLQDNVRSEDVFGRFGGEEFLVLLPGKSRDEALTAAENLRRLVATYDFAHRERQPLGRVSISGGVATFPHDGADSRRLLAASDAALYQAKKAGRDRVLSAAEVGRPGVRSG